MSLASTTHGIGKFFWHSISLRKGTDIVHRHPSHEADYPYRWSNSLILRFPGTTKGLVLGWWHETTRTEEQAILAALSGRGLDFEELGSDQKANIRRNMIRNNIDAEKQQLIAEALEL